MIASDVTVELTKKAIELLEEAYDEELKNSFRDINVFGCGICCGAIGSAIDILRINITDYYIEEGE